MNRPDFDSLFLDIPLPLFVVDIQSQSLVWANRNFYQWIGQPSESLCGHAIEEFLDTDSALEISKNQRIERTAFACEKPMKIVLKTGESFTAPFSLSESVLLGRSYKLVWLHRGLQLPKSEKEMDQNQELIHLSRLADMGRLSAGIAHELNNPLMIIHGYAENLGMLLESGKMECEEFKLSLKQILKSVHRMNKILSGIKRFVRNDDFTMVTVDLNEVIPEALNLMSSQLKAARVHVEVEMNIARWVKCDPSQIEQIIVNILSNAIHALNENKTPKNIKINFHESERQLSLEIWNNGQEVPLAIREKILSPFFTTKPVGTGTGLGLSVSYGIMKSHNGNLRFSSDSDRGTSFFLDFPKIEAFVGQSDDFKKAKVLVVDDEESFNWIFANKLRLFGFEVFTTESGSEALKILGDSPEICGTFVDFRMPEMDGITLTKQIRQSFGTSHHVFMVTGFPLSFSEELNAKRAGVNQILLKPVSVDQLSEAIKVLTQDAKKAS